MKELANAISRADELRNQKRFTEAAWAYRAAISIDPTRSGLWVQLGNMLKDVALYSDAEAAYSEALRLSPNDADTWLQRGRNQRLSERRIDALRSFARVLCIVPGHADAISELIQLGEGWQAGQIGSLGPRLLFDVLDTTARMRELIARVEADLPAIAALNKTPLSHYDIFRKSYVVPHPPKPSPEFGLCVLIRGNGPLDLVLLALRALQEQTHPSFTVAMPDLLGEAALAFARLTLSRPERFVNLTPNLAEEFIRSMPSQMGVVIAIEPLILDREALAWLAASLAAEGTAGVLCDEDRMARKNLRPYYEQPLLRGECDLEMLEQGIDAGRMIAGRSELVDAKLMELDGKEESVAKLALSLARFGRIEIVRQPLASHINPNSRPIVQRFVPSLRHDNVIAVVIPTRDRLDLLVPAIATARETARASSRLRIIVVDNGSVDPATKYYLANEAQLGHLQSLRVDEPFNWSRLNRLGAAEASDAGLLVFMNNDVKLLTHGWDDAVADLLARPEVGAVGARLFYPDGTIQHAGIVVTADGRTDHDGRGEPGTSGGPAARYLTRRSVTAVTGAFLATRRKTFDEIGGFDDENLPIWFNDTDFCLKVWATGRRVIYEPAIVATHFEGKTLKASYGQEERDALFKDANDVMRRRWGDAIVKDRWSRTELLF